MHGPPLVAWLLVVLSVTAAATCLVRREAGDEALMGAGMAVMSVPLSVLDPPAWITPLFAVVFTLAAVRALLLARHRPGHHLHHMVCSGAMVYTAVAMAAAGPAAGAHLSQAGHESAGTPPLTGLLLLYFAGYVLRTGMTLVAVPTTARPLISTGSGPLRVRYVPEVAVACRVSMALGMFAMLLAL